MNEIDSALCQQAINLANSGQKQAAYQILCELHRRGNTEDITVLSWLAYTTPSLQEAQQAMDTIARLEPYHPKLPDLQKYVANKQQQFMPPPMSYAMPAVPVLVGPVLQCPYCHYTGPVRITQKVSTGGWIALVVLLLVFFPLFWIGLLIKEDHYTCSQCGIDLGRR